MKNTQTVITKTETLALVILIHINVRLRLLNLLLCLIFISNSWDDLSFTYFFSALLHAEECILR
jgi:hypothetical protein